MLTGGRENSPDTEQSDQLLTAKHENKDALTELTEKSLAQLKNKDGAGLTRASKEEDQFNFVRVQTISNENIRLNSRKGVPQVRYKSAVRRPQTTANKFMAPTSAVGASTLDSNSGVFAIKQMLRSPNPTLNAKAISMLKAVNYDFSESTLTRDGAPVGQTATDTATENSKNLQQ